MISIIIRAKNEEKWIGHCLKAVFNQTYQDIEVILVDNNSTDRTVDIAKEYNVNVMNIEKFLPGKAINMGVDASKGDIVVLLSAHCIPTNETWLEKLVQDFKDPEVVGIYGRQEPMSFSSDFDKRDLLITFGLDKKIQKKDSFFHNANSAIRKDILSKHPFSDSLTNIEDRAWGVDIINAGHTLVYEPEASVYHHHGIHQNGDPQRCHQIVRILEDLDLVPALDENKSDNKVINKEADHYDIIIPSKGVQPLIEGKNLLEFTLERIELCPEVRNVYVLTDSEETKSIAEKYGAEVPFLRKKDLSEDNVDVETVLQSCAKDLIEQGKNLSNLIVMYPTTPFRNKDFIQNLIQHYKNKKDTIDGVVAVTHEYDPCWSKTHGGFSRNDKGLIPRIYKDPTYLAIQGLGCITTVDNILNKSILGEKMGLMHIKNPLSRIEIRTQEEADMLGSTLQNWWGQE